MNEPVPGRVSVIHFVIGKFDEKECIMGNKGIVVAVAEHRCPCPPVMCSPNALLNKKVQGRISTVLIGWKNIVSCSKM